MGNRYDFTDRIALVTGGGSGIGEACVRVLADGGARVLVVDLSEERARRVADSIPGGNAAAFRADVSKPEENEAMVAEAIRRFGGLDVAINNAGIAGASAPTGEYPLDAWRQVIDVNLLGVFYGMRYEIPAMVERGGGAIVNMSSILGSVGFANASAYVAAKHGVVGLTRTAAAEYATQGVRVNAVGPAFIATPLVEEAMDEAAQRMLVDLHPIGRLGTADEVATLTAFLASDDASFVTGSYHLVDGGYTTR